jgi:putative membrane protein
MMGVYAGGMGPIGWLAMGLFWLVLLGLILWLVAQLLPSPRTGGGTDPDASASALEILDRRLASGETDLETWRVQRAALVAVPRDRK